MCSVFASCTQKNQLSGVERSAAFSFAGQQSTGMGNSNALARPRGRPAPENRCEHCRNTPQRRDARNARALGAKTQMKHHATSTRFNVDIMIAWCNNCVDVYAGRQKNVQRKASGHLPQGTSGQIYTPWHRGACNAPVSYTHLTLPTKRIV